MNILILLLPLALLLGVVGLTAFLIAARAGQFDDLETPALRALLDESERKKDR